MAKRKGAKSWRRSEAAHWRDARVADYHKSLVSFHYHRNAAIYTKVKRRVLSPDEKKQLFAEAKAAFGDTK